MEPTRGAYFLLRSHLLHFDAPRPAKSGKQNVGSSGQTTGNTGSPGGSNHPTSGSPGQDAKRMFGKGNQGNNEAVNFIRDHIKCVHLAGDVGGQKGPLRAPSMPPGVAERLSKDLEYALYCLEKSHERFPAPQLPLSELIRAVVQHMTFHRNAQGAVAGDYILKALIFFFGFEKNETFSRFVTPLVDVGCVVGAAGARGSKNVADFERSHFIVQSPVEITEVFRHKHFREMASRLVCIYCTRTVADGANELIYMSHSRWVFGEAPTRTDLNPNDPCGPFPDHYRRGLLGPLFQFINSYCLSECKMMETLHDQCAIVRLNGVKFAIAQLFPSNVPELLVDGESGKRVRCDAPCILLMGFPEHVPHNAIHLGVKKILDAVELCCGPRGLCCTTRALPGSDLSPEAFRNEVRHIGAKIYSLCTHLFFSAECPDAAFQQHVHGAEDKRELSGLVDNGVMEQIPMAQRSKRPYNGFPTRIPFTVNHRSSTHTLSRRNCSSATQILLSLRDTCAQFGGCVCSAMFHHGSLIISDSHPYVTSLLGLYARWSLYKAAPSSASIGISDADMPSVSLGSHRSEFSTGYPVRDQMPTGIFADSTFGEFGDVQLRGHHDSSGAGSPSAASPRGSMPASPTCRESSSAVPYLMQGTRSTGSGATIADEDTGLHGMHEHNLYLRYCFLSEEIVALLPRPTTCHGYQSQGSPDRHECSESVDRATHQPLMESGFYHTVHLSASGIDVILVLPTSYHRDVQQFPSEVPIAERICQQFQAELTTLGREISSLATHMTRADVIPREVESGGDGGGSEGTGNHVDPNNTGRDGAGGNTGSAAPLGNGATTQTVASASSVPLCLVHDLALGVGEFVDYALGSQEEVAHHQRVVPSGLMLNRAAVFLKESNAVSALLGMPLRLPNRHPDQPSTNPPFAIEPTTRVVLGRSAFADKDRRGPHTVIYARQSGGQQVYFGLPSTASAGFGPASLRTIEDQYVQFVSGSRSHTVVI